MKNPEIVSELQRIQDENGGLLRPVDVVEAARPESSPLHGQFEWDDSEAGEQYRIWQARQLIRVTVELIESDDDGRFTRAFVSLTTDRNSAGGYRAMTSVMRNTTRREQLLQDAMNEMERFQKRYAILKELAGVFAAMRKVKPPRSVKKTRAAVA